MKTFRVCTIFLLIVSNHFSNSSPIPDSNEVDQKEAKGILDGLNESTTAAPTGLGNISGLGQNIGNAGPMLIIGGFQAVVTKFDPSLIQGLPGFPGGALPVGK